MRFVLDMSLRDHYFMHVIKGVICKYDCNYVHFEEKMPRKRTYSRYAEQAAQLLGQHIRLTRKKKQWSQQELAERSGVGRTTVQKAEAGDMGLEIGLAFELASIAGIPLFAPETSSLALTQSASLEREIRHAQELLSLLPKNIHKPRSEPDDDF
jgi:transcriptional regulator with XRE-family HTH domain